MPEPPGAVRHPAGPVPINAGRERTRVRVTNRSRRPVRVSSHYPFWRANHRLDFDRAAATGFHLDLPAGSSLQWAPGETREVDLVRFVGVRD